MNVEEFKTAVDAIAEARGVSHQAVINALHDALQMAYTSYLRGPRFTKSKLPEMEEARVEVKIDEENGHVTICQLKKVVDEVQDDYLEISPEDAQYDAEDKIDTIKEELAYLKSRGNADKKAEMRYLVSLIEDEAKHIKVGEDYRVYCPFETLSKLTAASFRKALTEKINDAGHEVLYEIYKDHIGELVTGTVEAVSGSSVTVNIGKGTTDLMREDLIGDEDFKLGDIIKVYIEEVKQPKGDNSITKRINKSKQHVLVKDSLRDYSKKKFTKFMMEQLLLKESPVRPEQEARSQLLQLLKMSIQSALASVKVAQESKKSLDNLATPNSKKRSISSLIATIPHYSSLNLCVLPLYLA